VGRRKIEQRRGALVIRSRPQHEREQQPAGVCVTSACVPAPLVDERGGSSALAPASELLLYAMICASAPSGGKATPLSMPTRASCGGLHMHSEAMNSLPFATATGGPSAGRTTGKVGPLPRGLGVDAGGSQCGLIARNHPRREFPWPQFDSHAPHRDPLFASPGVLVAMRTDDTTVAPLTHPMMLH